MGPYSHFNDKELLERYYEEVAKSQMEIEIIARTGVVLPTMKELIMTIATATLAELQLRGKLRTPDVLILEKIRLMKNRPDLMKQFVNEFKDKLSMFSPEILAEIPPEAFE